MRGRLLILLLLGFVIVLAARESIVRATGPDDGPPSGAAAKALSERYEEGREFWRGGDYERAAAIWRSLETEIGPARAPSSDEGRVFSRSALFHALGNAAFRAERPLEAVGYYSRALRHRPRDPALRRNLALARGAADLPEEAARPTFERIASVASPAESRWLVLIGLIPLAIGGLAEALRGGLLGRLLAVLGLVAAGVCAMPFLAQRFGPDPPGLLVVAEGSVDAHSEPSTDAARVGEVEPGARLREVERWPGWVRVELRPDLRSWVPESSVFPLAP